MTARKELFPHVQILSTGSGRPCVAVPVIYNLIVLAHKLMTLKWCFAPVQENYLTVVKPEPSSIVPQGMMIYRLGVTALRLITMQC